MSGWRNVAILAIVVPGTFILCACGASSRRAPPVATEHGGDARATDDGVHPPDRVTLTAEVDDGCMSRAEVVRVFESNMIERCLEYYGEEDTVGSLHLEMLVEADGRTSEVRGTTDAFSDDLMQCAIGQYRRARFKRAPGEVGACEVTGEWSYTE